MTWRIAPAAKYLQHLKRFLIIFSIGDRNNRDPRGLRVGIEVRLIQGYLEEVGRFKMTPVIAHSLLTCFWLNINIEGLDVVAKVWPRVMLFI